MSKLSNAQVAKMRAQLEAHDQEQAAATKAAEIEFIQPLSDVVGGDEWTALETQLSGINAQYLDDHFIYPHLNAILTAMRNLPLEVARRTKA